MEFKEFKKRAKAWKNRSDTENAQINTQWLKQNVVSFDGIALKETPWVFSHIPKTAGTSLESYIIQAFELKDFLHINAPDLNRLPQALYIKNKYPKFISGHHPLHGLLYQLLPQRPIVHVTMLRNPISRVVSYYNYLATREYHALYKQIKGISFDDFLERADLVEIQNGQSKRLAGLLHSDKVDEIELYEKAQDAIDNCFSLVGVTEFFGQYHKLLAKKCGVSFTELPPINRSKTKIQLTYLTDEQKDKIKNLNRIDVHIYEYAKAKFLELLDS